MVDPNGAERPPLPALTGRGERPRAAADARGVESATLPRLAGPGTALFLFVAAVVALAPLPLGSGPPLAWSTVALAVAVALLWSAVLPLDWPSAAAAEVAAPAILWAAALGWIVVQSVSFTPAAWHAGIWRDAGEALGQALPGAIAADRQAPMASLVRLLSYTGVFYLALRLGREPQRAKAAIALVAVSGCAYAAYALVAFWAGNTRLLWLPKIYFLKDLSGTFPNRNSYATYLALVLLAVVGRGLDRFEALRLSGAWRTRLAQLSEFVGGNVWQLLAVFVVATALLCTHSRGGCAAAAAGLVALAGARALGSGFRPRRSTLWLAVVGGLALIAIGISGGTTIDRILGTDISTEERMAVWRQVIRAIGDHPFAGTGLGSFGLVFPAYRTADVLNLYTRAHNDYLETMLELGIPAALCQFAALAWLAGLCLRGARQRRRDAVIPSLGFAATIVVGLQSLADFSLQWPAVAIVYAFVLGTGVAQSRGTREAPRPGVTVG
jgi:O-antigen ligase